MTYCKYGTFRNLIRVEHVKRQLCVYKTCLFVTAAQIECQVNRDKVNKIEAVVENKFIFTSTAVLKSCSKTEF